MEIRLPALYTFQIPVIPFTPFALAQKLRVFYGLIPHEGIVYSLNWNYLTQEWEITIAHLSKDGRGVSLTSLGAFAGGNKVHIAKSPSSPQHEATIIDNIDAALRWQALNGNIQYFLAARNCQHFTTWAYGEEPKSESLNAAGLALGGMALFALIRFYNDPN
jgi:hypothetical protein